MTRARILIVDDDAASRAPLELLLRSEGYQVEGAEDGQVALERVLEQAPDLVVTDIHMPRMDGITLLGEIRKHPRCSTSACAPSSTACTSTAW